MHSPIFYRGKHTALDRYLQFLSTLIYVPSNWLESWCTSRCGRTRSFSQARIANLSDRGVIDRQASLSRVISLSNHDSFVRGVAIHRQVDVQAVNKLNLFSRARRKRYIKKSHLKIETFPGGRTLEVDSKDFGI